MLQICLIALVSVAPALALLASLRIPALLPVQLTRRPALLAVIEAVLWVLCVQLTAEWFFIRYASSFLYDVNHTLRDFDVLGIAIRMAAAVPVCCLPFFMKVTARTGIIASLLWAVLLSQPALMTLSHGHEILPPLASANFLIVTVTPISLTYFILGSLWFLSIQRVQGGLPPLFPVNSLVSRWKSPQSAVFSLWLEVFLLNVWLGLGLILASTGLLSTHEARIAHYGLVLFYNVASVMLCFWFLWHGNTQVRSLLDERERQTCRQISGLEQTLFMRQQQICQMLAGAGAGAIFWQARNAHIRTGSREWRTGEIEYRVNALDLPNRVRPDDNLEIFFRKILPVTEFKRLAAALDSVFLGDETQFALELEGVLTPTGSHAYKLFANALRSSEGPGVLFFDMLMIDYNDERALRHQLHHSAEIRRDTLFSVGHDLGSPLGLIRISSSLLRRHLDRLGGMDEVVRRQLARIEACVLEAHAYLRNALDFAQSDSPDYRYPRTDLQPVPWLRALVDNQMVIYGVNASAVRLEIPSDCLLRNIQEQPFQMLATNLVSNAFKYGACSGGKVLIRLSKERSSNDSAGFVFEVADEGSGLPDNVRKTLYQPFQRGNNIAGVAGSGLGLSIVRRAAQCLDARIELLAVPRGTHFQVTVPVLLEHLQPEVPA